MLDQFNNKFILEQIKEIREITDIEEVAQMLSSGNWIALCATRKEPYCFCLARVKGQADQ